MASGFYSDTDASGKPLYDPLFLSNYVDQSLSDENRASLESGDTTFHFTCFSGRFMLASQQ